ncbi:DUF3649 domain-containing protein [Pseudomonas mangrovi]|jgi:hypothetical protein|uniref:DUF3649 domain-containing protein n=1 Tax=Pseudomonas mangrovi TaxID=2161748 RepID=A0A2T5PEJ1_9PSED|nr:DUF3649 domain-containing protein [Pseudomonas mangrovi]PTU76156.1 hypothetical protein DBO85_00510 [Pseudomonas mangrovi]
MTVVRPERSAAPKAGRVRASRWSVASRTLAAALGGYALANSLPVALLAMLPMSAADAALSAIQLSFLVYLGAILWAFAARSAWHAWLGLLLPAAASLLLGGWAIHGRLPI